MGSVIIHKSKMCLNYVQTMEKGAFQKHFNKLIAYKKAVNGLFFRVFGFTLRSYFFYIEEKNL